MATNFFKIFTIIFFILVHSVAFAETFLVVGVTDGDTLKVLSSEKQIIKVRLAKIDAPEKKQDWSLGR